MTKLLELIGRAPIGVEFKKQGSPSGKLRPQILQWPGRSPLPGRGKGLAASIPGTGATSRWRKAISVFQSGANATLISRHVLDEKSLASGVLGQQMIAAVALMLSAGPVAAASADDDLGAVDLLECCREPVKGQAGQESDMAGWYRQGACMGYIAGVWHTSDVPPTRRSISGQTVCLRRLNVA
jgi:hypothetical protein